MRKEIHEKGAHKKQHFDLLQSNKSDLQMSDDLLYVGNRGISVVTDTHGMAITGAVTPTEHWEIIRKK